MMLIIFEIKFEKFDMFSMSSAVVFLCALDTAGPASRYGNKRWSRCKTGPRTSWWRHQPGFGNDFWRWIIELVSLLKQTARNNCCRSEQNIQDLCNQHAVCHDNNTRTEEVCYLGLTESCHGGSKLTMLTLNNIHGWNMLNTFNMLLSSIVDLWNSCLQLYQT